MPSNDDGVPVEDDMRESIESQIDRLANVIMHEIDGEPSASEGAVDTAIRLLRRGGRESIESQIDRLANVIMLREIRLLRGGRIVHDNDRYRVTDRALNGATVSETVLHAGKSTRGHSHEREEAYLFVDGEAALLIGGRRDPARLPCTPGAVYTIPGGEHHQVETIGGCRFYTLFIGARDA
jgi:mannose-6-phosphate isomerase-like protein (cupin superfamily)